ncbi:F-box protein At2g35280-like [Bidens hawaiensis]|uniref:F-box protein At2g35280-like n=1 Tax=Bidens hawaiensis TaxID=980011 RepID=UPI0040492D9D
MGIPKKTAKNTKDDRKSLSVRRHSEKRVGKLVNQPKRTILSLPKDLLVNILARVASSSFTDLFNAKLCCKDFLKLASHDYIFQCISIDKFTIIQWTPPRDRARFSFLTHCFNKGNPESLFRQGMLRISKMYMFDIFCLTEYFNIPDVESGLEYLKRAVEKGHTEAIYAYGMILLSRGDDQSDQQGLNLLNSVNHSRSRCWNVKETRKKVESIYDQIRGNDPVTPEKVYTKCQKQDHVRRFETIGWSFERDEEITSCDVCRWYRELVYCRAMNIIFKV